MKAGLFIWVDDQDQVPREQPNLHPDITHESTRAVVKQAQLEWLIHPQRGCIEEKNYTGRPPVNSHAFNQSFNKLRSPRTMTPSFTLCLYLTLFLVFITTALGDPGNITVDDTSPQWVYTPKVCTGLCDGSRGNQSSW